MPEVAGPGLTPVDWVITKRATTDDDAWNA